MTPERWHEVTRIFHAAAARDSAARDAFLANACRNDPALRAEVDAMLDAHRDAGSFGETPVVGVPRDVTLAPGTRIGAFVIEASLGAGGMGEVYRARDTRLGRDVAIKVLPGLFKADPDRLARFEREARALATLNHPHVGAIYGIEDSGGTPALILELAEGPSLAECLEKGPLRVEEALDVARQVAEALEAAHERGIVHRDLKPANIKIAPAGVTKVLDFGLAKVVPASVPPPRHDSAAPNVAGTLEGLILGTTAYMSPEQARGQAVDKRSDIWAFGCVLCEMLTGRAVFAGTTASDTLARIVERDVDWGTLPTATPPSVIRLLRRCLDKDPKRRLHDIADARIELEDAISGEASAPEIANRSVARLAWTVAAAAVVAAVVSVAGVAWQVRAAREPTTAARISRVSMASSGVAAVTVAVRTVALTPDGTRVVYIGNNGSQIFVQPLDQLDATAIVTATRTLYGVFVSPDGQWVGFSEGNALRKVAITGGPTETIATNSFSGATWLPDGTLVMADDDPGIGLQRVSASGGPVTTLTRPVRERGELDHLWPEMLPGGRTVLFTITATSGGLDAARVAAFDLETGAVKGLLTGGSHAVYAPSGHLLYTAGGTLRAVQFDVERLEPRGAPITVMPRLSTTPRGSGNFAVASDGTLAYVDAPDVGAAPTSTLVWVDRKGGEQPLAAPPRAYRQPRLSQDGKRMAISIGDQVSDIWILDLTSQTLSQFTFGSATHFFPVWTHDDSRIIYTQLKGGAQTLFWKRSDGQGSAEALGTTGLASGVTPDGKRLLFHSFDQDDRNLMTLALDGARQVESLLATPSNERNGVVSPDGRWLAYESDSSGTFEIMCFGTTGAVTRLWHGQVERVVMGLPSYIAPNGNVTGPHDISFAYRGGAFLTIGLANGARDPNAARSAFGSAAARLGKLLWISANGTTREIADLAAYEFAANPAGGPTDSNPFGLLADGRATIVADAGANALLQVENDGTVSTVAVFPPVPSSGADAVPTAVQRGADGAYYVSQLTGAPFVAGAARIYRVVPGSAPQIFAEGFKAIIDLAFGPDGSLYVLEHASGPMGFAGPGGIKRIAPNGARTVVLEGSRDRRRWSWTAAERSTSPTTECRLATGEVLKVEP